MGEHKFWSTQPVPQPGDAPPQEDGAIEPPKPRDQIQKEPDPLPEGLEDLEWTTVDLLEPSQSKDVYELLLENYVEDNDEEFRFLYSTEFLNWAMMPPGYHPEWHLGVRVKSMKKLVAFISGIPIKIRVRETSLHMCEINFLCVHKERRSKRLTPALFKEVTRQYRLKGVWQAIYTGGVVLPTPVSTCRYFHRSLNIPKLVDIKFTHIPSNTTLAQLVLHHKLPSATSIKGLREMEEKDIPNVKTLWERYIKRFSMYPEFTEDELRHNLVGGRGRGGVKEGRRDGQVVWSYVVKEEETNIITDFFSFYSLPTQVVQSTEHELLEVAYLFYYATSVAFEANSEWLDLVKLRLLNLIGDALVIADQAKFDVFNALTLMDNNLFLRDLKFGPGDGYLKYYLYNWRTAPLEGFKALPAEEGGQGIGRGVAVVML